MRRRRLSERGAVKEFDFRKALAEGFTDMIGFLLGAAAGWWLSTLFGFDFIRGTGFGTAQIIGLAFILVVGGAGRFLARKLLERSKGIRAP